MSVTLVKIYAPGTRVMLADPPLSPWYGRVVVCLCKRHTWQPQLQGRECGHARGFRVEAEACPWPMHVVWVDGNESHQGDGIEPVGSE